MTIRARYLVLASTFALLAVCVAEPAERQTHYVPAAVAAGFALVFLGIGVWDSGRNSHYVLGDDEDAPS